MFVIPLLKLEGVQIQMQICLLSRYRYREGNRKAFIVFHSESEKIWFFIATCFERQVWTSFGGLQKTHFSYKVDAECILMSFGE